METQTLDIIAYNNTNERILLADIGIFIDATSSVNLVGTNGTFDKDEISASNNLKTYVSSGDITINDGTEDLNIENGLKHITIETEWEDTFSDPQVKVSETDNVQDYLVNKLIGTTSVIMTTIIGPGGNEQLQVDISPEYVSPIISVDHVADDTLSSTTSTTFQNKLSLTSPSITGWIRVGYSMEYNAGQNNKEVEVRLYNSTEDIDIGNGIQSTNASTNYFTFSGFHYRYLTGTPMTYVLQFRQITGICSVRNAELEIMRIA